MTRAFFIESMVFLFIVRCTLYYSGFLLGGTIGSTGALNFGGGVALGLGGTTVIQPSGQSLT